MPLKEMDNPRGEGRKREERESLCFELRISFDFWPDLHCLVSGARTASLRQQSSSPLPPQCSHCVPLSSLLLWDWDPSCLTTGPSPPVPAQLRRTHENSTETWGRTLVGDWLLHYPGLPALGSLSQVIWLQGSTDFPCRDPVQLLKAWHLQTFWSWVE